MGLRQTFTFAHASRDAMQGWLERLGDVARLERVADDFVVFSQLPGEPALTFECELTPSGIQSDRAGDYFQFVGVFIESLTGHFGAVTVADI